MSDSHSSEAAFDTANERVKRSKQRRAKTRRVPNSGIDQSYEDLIGVGDCIGRLAN